MPVGIPDRKNFGDLDQLSEGDLLDYVRQLHHAKKAGRHYDVRLGNKRLGLYSWATRKDYPESGKSIQLFRQPMHSYRYKKFQGTIPFGYGAGHVKTDEAGSVLITKKNNNLSFTTAHDQSPRRYALINAKTKNPLLVRAKSPEHPPVSKPKFKTIKPGKVNVYVHGMRAHDLAQPKVDGAFTMFHILPNKEIEALSHRVSKRTGKPIFHTERFFKGRPKLNIPNQYLNSVLLAEMYGERDGKAIPPQELGGILNSTIAGSLARQKDVKLKALLFDLAMKDGKKTTELPYKQRLEELKKIVKYLPGKDKFEIPETVEGPEKAESLLDRIRKGRHPLTAEGLIVRKENEPPVKVKLFDEHDVHIKKIFEGEGKYAGKSAGGFWYSLTPDGEVVGKVGSGLSDEVREDMFKNPSKYIGRTARIKAQEQYKKTGAFRAPVFLALHESK